MLSVGIRDGSQARNPPFTMKLLFQGDSVTDCGRDRSQPGSLGGGYVAMIAKSLSDSGDTIINRGVSGDRVQQLDARWDADCVNLQPGILTILIGINDVWRQFDSGLRLDLEVFEMTYQRLIDRASPATGRIILMEPFLIPADPEKAPMRPFVDAIIQVVHTLARRNSLTLVPLDTLFAAASAVEPPSHWAEDGIHPTSAGHRLIADAWLQALQSNTNHS